MLQMSKSCNPRQLYPTTFIFFSSQVINDVTYQIETEVKGGRKRNLAITTDRLKPYFSRDSIDDLTTAIDERQQQQSSDDDDDMILQEEANYQALSHLF